MDMEARSLPPEKSRPLLAKVKEFRADLATLKDSLKSNSASQSVGDVARAELVRRCFWRLHQLTCSFRVLCGLLLLFTSPPVLNTPPVTVHPSFSHL